VVVRGLGKGSYYLFAVVVPGDGSAAIVKKGVRVKVG
jgi:hypothetical protein